MTTSQKTRSLSEIRDAEQIPAGVLAYFQARARNTIYEYIIGKFLEKETTGKLSRAQLARRIRRSPDRISHILGAPGNWTVETISDLLLGIANEEFIPSSKSVLDRPQRNFSASDLIAMRTDNSTASSGDAVMLGPIQNWPSPTPSQAA